MATSRTYEDSCGVAHALELVGERWAMLVVRELMLGAKRYSDLRADLPGISSNVLSHRLDELERAGLLRRRTLPPPAASHVYDLTEWGRELEPVLRDLGRWAARSPSHRTDLAFSVTSLVLSLRTNFDAALAGDVTADVALVCGHEVFRARVADGALTVARGGVDGADAVVRAAPPVVASLIYGGRPLADAERTGELVVTGDRAVAARLLGLYSLPEPAVVDV